MARNVILAIEGWLPMRTRQFPPSARTMYEAMGGRHVQSPGPSCCLTSGHSSRVSRDIVQILVGGVMGDVDGAGCDHGGGAGRPVQERGGARLWGVSPVGADPGGPVSGRGRGGV